MASRSIGSASVADLRDQLLEAARLYQAGELGAGLEVLETALDRCERSPALGLQHYIGLQCLVSKAWFLLALGRLEELRETLVLANGSAQSLWSSDPEHALTGWLQLARLADEIKDEQSSRTYRQAALNLGAEHLGEDHPRYLQLQSQFKASTPAPKEP